jgi:polyhydroxyalkanoate synthesis regulator phasin
MQSEESKKKTLDVVKAQFPEAKYLDAAGLTLDEQYDVGIAYLEGGKGKAMQKAATLVAGKAVTSLGNGLNALHARGQKVVTGWVSGKVGDTMSWVDQKFATAVKGYRFASDPNQVRPWLQQKAQEQVMKSLVQFDPSVIEAGKRIDAGMGTQADRNSLNAQEARVRAGMSSTGDGVVKSALDQLLNGGLTKIEEDSKAELFDRGKTAYVKMTDPSWTGASVGPGQTKAEAMRDLASLINYGKQEGARRVVDAAVSQVSPAAAAQIQAEQAAQLGQQIQQQIQQVQAQLAQIPQRERFERSGEVTDYERQIRSLQKQLAQTGAIR